MVDLITSLQNPRVKLANALQTQAKTRRKERKIVLEGTRLLRDAVERGFKPEFILYTPREADYEVIALLQDKGDVVPVTDDVMRHVTETQQPQGIIGVFPLPMPSLPSDPSRVLILDAVRDPGNMGTILRTAAAAGVQVVILAPGCVDHYNPKVLRGGMGAHFRLPIIEDKWPQIVRYCETLAVYLTTGAGETRYDSVDWTQPWAVIIGGEADGAGSEAAALAKHRVAIPMAAQTESLNAAVASAVILFEAQRQRTQSKP